MNIEKNYAKGVKKALRKKNLNRSAKKAKFWREKQKKKHSISRKVIPMLINRKPVQKRGTGEKRRWLSLKGFGNALKSFTILDAALKKLLS